MDSKNRDQANDPKTSSRFVDFVAHPKTISGFARVEYLVQIQTSGLTLYRRRKRSDCEVFKNDSCRLM